MADTSGDDAVQAYLLGEAVVHGRYVVLVADETMRYLAASDAACKLLGYERSELLELTVPQVVEEPDSALRYSEMVQAGGQRGEVTLICKNGERIRATYEASETRVAKMTYYVSILFPIED